MVSVREAALEILERVKREESYTNLLLLNFLRKSKFSSKDKALLTELVYGTLRRQGTLDWLISLFSSQKISDLPSYLLNLLRLSVYQIIYLGKVPDYAVCNEAVEIAKRKFHKGISKFVNGLLRTIIRKREEIPWPSIDDDPISYISICHSHPKWLVKMWVKTYGTDTTLKICEANNKVPLLTARVNTLKITTSDLLSEFKKRGIRTKLPELAGDAFIIEKAGDVEKIYGFKEGFFQVQDEASILVGEVVLPQPDELVFDVCAAPGGKTTHLAALMKNRGRIVAVDINPSRLKLVEEACKRLGVEIVEVVCADATKLDELVKEKAKRILVDAPCSGLGTLRRRPELRWRISPSQIKELSELQFRLLSASAKVLEAGGILVYSVCTITEEEGEGVIRRFLKKHPNFSLKSFKAGRIKADKGFIQILPHAFNSNGMFIAKLTKEF